MNKAPLVLAMLLAGCTLGPAYQKPELELPAAWKESAPRFAQDGKWWRIYGDAQLESLVEEALAKNQDLVLAVARVDEARGVAGEVESGLFPSVSATGSAARQRVSTRTATFPPGGV